MTDMYSGDYAKQLYNAVEAHQDEIFADADAGNTTAKTIISTYNMLVSFPEWAAFGILEMSFHEWLKSKGVTHEA